jgi:hypothetical protein
MGTKQTELVKEFKCLPRFKLSIAIFEFFGQYLGAQGNWLEYQAKRLGRFARYF